MTKINGLVVKLASDVIAGPGQNPPNPHPIPNKTEPIMSAGVISF